MTDWSEIDKPCSRCGLIGISICSETECPMKDKQKKVRERWQNQENSSEENKSSS